MAVAAREEGRGGGDGGAVGWWQQWERKSPAGIADVGGEAAARGVAAEIESRGGSAWGGGRDQLGLGARLVIAERHCIC